MTGSAAPRRAHRPGFVAIVLLVAIALVAAMASVAGAKEGPSVPAAGVGTKAALDSPQCDKSDGRLAYPYQQRAPCTAPLKAGQSNGGATAQGVTKNTIKVVLLLGTHDQQDTAAKMPGGSAPQNHATGQPGYIEETYPDWQTVLDHNFNTWGRKFEFVTVHPTGADEAAQRADALTVAEMKPFIVVSSAPAVAGGGQVFAADLVAKKIIVFYGGITNAEAGKQAPYRYLGGFDNNATVINAVQFAARQLQGETAKWSGDFTTKKRVFGLIRPESGIDWQYFGSTAKKEGLKIASGGEEVYSVPIDTSQITAKNQEEAPVLVAKLKDAGVTTVMMFTSFGMNQQVLKAADSLDYHPEWFFTGLGAQDIEITARILQAVRSRADEARVRARRPAAVRLGHRRPAGELVQLVLGQEPGRLLGRNRRDPLPHQHGRESRGTEAHRQDLPAGHVQLPDRRRRGEQPGAELHVRHGPVTRPPVRRVLPGGTRLRHHVVEPHRDRQGQDPLRRRHRPVHVHRQRQALLRR